MKRILSFAGALLLFVFTCIGLYTYSERVIADKKEALIYYNKDNRNFCKIAMKKVFEDNTIPVFGSSELSASDEVAYPPSLFQNGNSDFNMILIGRGTMQCLHHTVNLGAYAENIPSHKVVLILSPQWFTSSHISSEAYASRFSERMYVEFLKNPDISYEIKIKVTERVKSLLVSDPPQLKRVETYEKNYLKHTLNPASHIEMAIYDSFMNLKQRFLLYEDIKDREFESMEPITAEDINFNQLMKEAENAGKEACTNNDLFIYDEYYDTYVKNSLNQRKDSEVNSSYLDSPEYDDFRLFLEVCKETGFEPLIVNIPVNGRWYDWTGFPKEERASYYQKIRSICEEYQVQIADFSDKEYEEYFLKDIMHLGWKGWVYLDEAVYHFYKEDKQ